MLSSPPTAPRGALLLGPVAAVLLGLGSAALGLSTAAAVTAGVTTLCAVWWVTEPVPVPVTSLIPFVAFPFAGILDHKAVASAYGHTLILLLLGGFVLSVAMERSGAHRRLAMGMVRLVGGRGGRRLVLGFMLATAVCSMWISNTATTLMLLPVALAVIEHERAGRPADAPRDPATGLTQPLLLGIAYAASIGGMGTPVGTPPNVILMGVYREVTGQDIGFAEWMAIGLPMVVVLLPIVWLWLTRRLESTQTFSLPALGAWTPAEKRVLMVFGVTALLWVTRRAPWGGWSGPDFLDVPGVGDSTIALLAVVAMFLIPDGAGDRLLDWPSARKIPWGLLLLFGGGIAIARAFEASGLSVTLGSFLANDVGIASWPTLAMIATICLMVTFLTEVTSNTATTTLLMPVLAAAAAAAALEPRLLMVPAALSASCAFMLPVATAPNAIIYGTGRVGTATMAREGFILNLAGALVLSLGCWLLVS